MILRARELTRIYSTGEGEVRALDGVDLDVAEGEMVAIMGSSGSGKSTLLNLLGCLDRPTSGTYELAGRDVSRLSDDELAGVRSRTLGFVFQTFHLLPKSTARDNVELPLIYSGVSPRERRARAEAALASVGLGDRMEHTPRKLSGGQQQRVAIARAIVNDPAVILADEPTGALDSRTTEEIMELLLRLRDEGRTVVIVTHEDDVATRCGRVVRLRDGRLA